jgi:predicted homoserine dehydrogenase-like protein
MATEMASAVRVRRGSALPFRLAAGARLTKPVAEGCLVTADAVEPPAGSVLWELRCEQDRLFAAPDPSPQD